MAKTILVLANQTVGGAKLLEKIRERAKEGDVRWILCVPQNRPRHGAVIYDEAVYQAAQVRLELARQYMHSEGVQIGGEVGDRDPFTAAMDAIAEFQPDEVIVSTLPVTQSGWLRRDLVERLELASGLPVEHVVVDIDKEGLPFDVTLVLANQTIGEAGLRDHLKRKAAERARLFIVVVPQESGLGHAAREARARVERTIGSLRDAGLLCAGMIGDPDPYNAAMNALQSFRVDDIVVSTLPETRSGWTRSHLIERLRSSTGKSVDHVVAEETQDKPAQPAAAF